MTDLILNQKDSLVNTQHVLVSAAKRTRMTLKTMDKLLEKKTVHYDNALYLASLATLKKQLENQNDNIENLLLIGHNDGLSDFASFLVGDYIYLPTSGYIELELPISSWTHVSKDIASIRAEFYSNFR